MTLRPLATLTTNNPASPSEIEIANGKMLTLKILKMLQPLRSGFRNQLVKSSLCLINHSHIKRQMINNTKSKRNGLRSPTLRRKLLSNNPASQVTTMCRRPKIKYKCPTIVTRNREGGVKIKRPRRRRHKVILMSTNLPTISTLMPGNMTLIARRHPKRSKTSVIR